MKICNSCKTDKPVSEFYKDKARKDGLTYKCKLCIIERNKKYYETNSEKAREDQKIYYAINIEKVLEAKKIYRKNNIEKLREDQKIYRKNNIEKVREDQKIYYAINKQSGL